MESYTSTFRNVFNYTIIGLVNSNFYLFNNFLNPNVWCKTEKIKTNTISFCEITWKIRAELFKSADGP